MLDKNSKKILKFLNKYSKNGHNIEIDVIIDRTKLNYQTVKDNLNYLISCEYVAQNTKLNKLCPSYSFYYSTIIGKSLFSNKLKNILYIFFTSFLCPIIISLITTLLTR